MMKKLFLLLAILTVVIATAGAESIVINMDPGANISHTKVLGVTDENESKGVIADLTVEVKPGSGRVFLDTLPLTKLDTQASARLAKEVACTTLEVDCAGLDFLYVIRSDFAIIGGPSAGAALAAATMAALQGIDMNQDVFASASINPAGSLGSIGGIREKAMAASEANGHILILASEQQYFDEDVAGDMISFVAEMGTEYNLTVVFAEDIIDAYKYFTGYQISKPNITSSDVVSEQLTTVLRKMAEGLMTQAEESHSDAGSNIVTAPLDKKEYLKTLVENSKTELDNADESYADESFYSASSFAVRSMINSYHANRLVRYYDADENPTFVANELNTVKTSIADFEILFLRNRTIDSINDVEVLSVVIDRIREAEKTVESAYEAYNQSDYETALYLCSYAEVRKNTAYQWLTLVNDFTGNTTYVFDPSAIKPLALERIEQSSTSVLYAKVVSNSILIEQAQEELDAADEAYNNHQYVFALFEAAKAMATANLAIEIQTTTNDSVYTKINQLEKSALVSIQKAESRGLTPILALSYLEFAKSFYESDPGEALVYLSYSKEMATISYEISESAFGDLFKLNNPPVVEKYYQEVSRFETNQEFTVDVILLITGVFAGIILTMYINGKK
ncbi:MAG: hypothetical protein PHC66_01260 [Candidatus Nanoarchaeia archaeon]|nr:hypothetical protein [Candidatus Nanoarchaeia archaeon]MDD5239122.1 hypothetical protein [Candidatus Nanoarchaeia archaeon]